MKKTYFAPATGMLQFESEEMIAASVPSVVEGTPADANAEVLDAGPKNVNVWGDEE